MKIPGWLKRAAQSDEAHEIERGILSALLRAVRLRFGPAKPVPTGTTGADVLREESR